MKPTTTVISPMPLYLGQMSVLNDILLREWAGGRRLIGVDCGGPPEKQLYDVSVLPRASGSNGAATPHPLWLSSKTVVTF